MQIETQTSEEKTAEIVARVAEAERQRKLHQLKQTQFTVRNGFSLKELAIAANMYVNQLARENQDANVDTDNQADSRWLRSRFPDIHTYGPHGLRY